jgi:hypothetical protein
MQMMMFGTRDRTLEQDTEIQMREKGKFKERVAFFIVFALSTFVHIVCVRVISLDHHFHAR